jgi:N-acetylneuraminic acid mutarotase
MNPSRSLKTVGLFLTAAVLSFVTYVSCSKSTTPAPVPICLSLLNYSFSEFGGASDSVVVTICGTAEVRNWTATPSAAWLTLSANSGTTPGGFVISVDTNHSGLYRAGTVTVTADGDANSKRVITIDQPTREAELCVSISEWTAPAAGGESPTATVANCGNDAAINWLVTRRPAWVHVSDSTGATPMAITLRVDTNKTSVTRVDTVEVSTCFSCVAERAVVSQEPIARPWTVRDTMPVRSWGFGAASINGKIYVSGGGSARWVNTLEYDAAAQSWTPKVPMPTDQALAGVAELSGSMYFMGGQNYYDEILSTVVSYTPATNAWTVRSVLPTSWSAGAACALNGKVYFVGGFNYAGLSGAMNEYNPSANAWMGTPASGFVGARSHLALVAAGGKLYAIGGYPATGLVKEFDPATSAWTEKAPMPTARWGLVAVTIAGKIYAIGGFDADENPLSAVEEYDPAMNTWAAKTPMPTRRALAAAAVLDNKVYVFGGNTVCPPDKCTFPNGWRSGAVEVYDPAEDLYP